MTLEEFIIHTYCFVDDFLQRFSPDPLRKRGANPVLSDSELLTMQLFQPVFPQKPQKC